MSSEISKKVFVVFTVFGLACASLYMHSPIELKHTDMMYIQYQNNKEVLSKDIITYPTMWYDNPKMMRHNFARFVAFLSCFAKEYTYAIVFVLYAGILLISLYIIGYELIKDELYALVPCFVYYFGFVLPDMQGQFHDHELNAGHLALSMVALSLALYVKGKVLIAYLVAASICYLRLRTGYTWGLIVVALIVRDLIKDKNLSRFLVRSLVPGAILIPMIWMTLPMMAEYDFSWLPEWAQYYPKISSPGGRSLVNLKNVYGWNGVVAGIIGVLNGYLLIFRFKGKPHMGTMTLIYTVSLSAGILAGCLHDFNYFEDVSKYYLLSIFSYVTLIEFFLLSLLFVEAYGNRLAFLDLFTCFYMIVLIPFFSDWVFQFGLFILIIVRFDFIGGKIKEKIKYVELIPCLLAVVLSLYVGFLRDPHYIGRWAENLYVIGMLSLPVLGIFVSSYYPRVRHYFGVCVITACLCIALLSAIYGHKREKSRFNTWAHEIEITKFLKENTQRKEISLGPHIGFHWSNYSERLVLVPLLTANKLQYNSKEVFPEMIRRSDIMFEKGAFKKYWELRSKGRDAEARSYYSTFWDTLNKERLTQIKKHYPVNYVIREKDMPLKDLETMYENESYIIYRLD